MENTVRTVWPMAIGLAALTLALAACTGQTGSSTASSSVAASSSPHSWESMCTNEVSQEGTSTWQSTDENSNKATITDCGYWVTQANAAAGNVYVWIVFAAKDD